MEVQYGPNAIDVPDLLYKLQRKIKVFNTSNSLPNRGYNLVASCSKYGIVFVLAPNSILSVYYLKDLINKECEPQHVSLKLQTEPSHIAVNCDQEWLAVISKTMLFVYKTIDFQNPNTSPSFSIKLDINPATFVSAVQWNPCITDTIAIAFFDGTLLVSQVTTMQVKKMQSNVRCICWSPKGKQLVTGNNDGTLCQYKPDLSPMKMVPAPNLFDGAAIEVLAIHWIATYQFLVVYKNATNNVRPAVTIVNTPKGGQPSCLNFEDICYSLGSNRPWYYYLYGLTQWNMVLASSSNSSEIATLASLDGCSWRQWCQIDEARPELPLTDGNQDNYPVGICVDTCSIHQLPWGENETLPPMPILHVLSQTGMLSIFNIINLKKDAAMFCTPPQQITLPANVMTSSIPDDVPQSVTVTSSAPVSQPVSQPVQQVQAPTPVQPAPVTSQPGKSFADFLLARQQLIQEAQAIPGFSSAVPPKIPEIKPIETKPQPPAPQNIVTSTPKPTKVEVSEAQSPIQQTQEMNAALKSEQERVNKLKVNEELMNMLIREVNDFQMELYKFQVKTRDAHIKLQQEIQSMGSNINIKSQDVIQLKKDSAVNEIRETVIMLKLDLVRVCAAVAEARTHAETRQMQEWSQADPLTMKRVSQIKKLAYYVQTQLDQAHKALDHKWNEMTSKSQYERPGERMIRPILDDIYQPLVKQQEILTRQKAVLKMLRNTLKECGDVAPMKTTSILRSTPFRNKADPISKVTKSIHNMSLEPDQERGEQMMSNQKLDALRDMLSNHKTVKIKPVNIELGEKLMEMRIKYENSVKERKAMLEKQKQEAQTFKIKQGIKSDVSGKREREVIKTEAKNETAKSSLINVPSYKPFSNVHTYKPAMGSVTRTLFTDEPKQEPVKFQLSQQKPKVPVQASTPEQAHYPHVMTITSSTLNMLKDMLQNKSQASAEAQNDANSFMGQPICKPTGFNLSKTATSVAANIDEIEKMRNKLQLPTSAAVSKLKLLNTNIKSSETGEAELNTNKPLVEKTVTNVFTLKPTASAAAKVLNVPDIVKTSNQTATKVEAKTKEEVKDKEKLTKLKENVPEKENKKVLNVSLKVGDDKTNEAKSFDLSNNPRAVFSLPSSLQISKLQTASTTQATSVFQSPMTSSTATKESTQIKTSEPVATPLPSTIFGAAYTAEKQNSVSKPTSPTGSIFGTSIFGTSTATTTPSSAKSIFGSAVLSTTFPASTSASVTEPKTTPDSTTNTTKAQAPTQITPPTATSAETTTITKTQSEVSTVDTTVTQSSLTPSTTAPVLTATSASAPTTTQSTLSTTTTAPSSPTTTQQSIFGDVTTQSSIFGKSTPSTQASIFGSTTETTQFDSAAPTTTQASIFGTPTATTQATIFGSPAATTQASIFGSPATTTQPSSFGGTTTTTQGSIFGTPATTTQASIFGSPTSTTQASVLGTSTTTTPASVFGTSTATTQASVFGTPTTTTQASVFGTPTTTTQASLFGTSTATTQGSIFGSPTATTQASVFGTSTTTTQASVFGTPTATIQASVFGTPTATTQGSIFGTPTATTQASIFGSPTTTTQGCIFGTTTTQSSSLFGGGEGNLFAAATISTTSAATPATGGNVFGGSSGSIFGGGNTNVFGGKTTFGQSNQSAASIFGAANASLKQDSTSNNFWGSGNTSGSGFGSSGFGQQATTQASIFGSSGGSFSTPATGQTLGSPQPGAFGEAKSVFGTPQQQTAPGFGGSPVFGSKPAFGQSASFGSSASFGGFGGLNKSPTGGFGAPATFGGAPAFGAPAFGGTSPGKVFGGAAPTPGFGSPTQSNSTFEALASQNTMTFGNLAQQSAQQNQPQPSFNTSPSFTGWRG
ncbi:PREDICTED: nuclear pore complex protein Nup214 isoform X1 [Papilio xuthus]|uniref:Nuclear pore complex protein Nup214 isoform X1 n=1 Tax=Papilio xuthus TaxID=66420 RepID=A0AAJ6ZBX2_PAPXU|nr:PREDICTED: nuclear pore complex protein Nup214 isoform X1 [Papilio xuthus]